MSAWSKSVYPASTAACTAFVANARPAAPIDAGSHVPTVRMQPYDNRVVTSLLGPMRWVFMAPRISPAGERAARQRPLESRPPGVQPVERRHDQGVGDPARP